jgi:hypothetical protein
MKKLLLVFAFSPLLMNAQVTYDIQFDDGSQKRVTMDYDDPENLPKFNCTFNFAGFSVVGTGILSYQLRPEFRFNDRMMVSGCFTTGYTRGLDDNIRYNSPYIDLYKKTSLLNLNFHFTAFTHLQQKEKKTAVDYGGNSVYVARIPRNIARSLQVDAGFSRIVTPSDLELQGDSVNANVIYHALNFQSMGGRIGLAYYKRESYQVTADGVSRSYFRYTRFYANALFAFSTGYTTYGTDYSSSSTPVTTEATAGFVAPEVNKMGWAVGIEKHLGIKNSTASMMIAVEFGKIPHLSTAAADGSKITAAPDVIQIHFGIGLGTRLPKN